EAAALGPRERCAVSRLWPGLLAIVKQTVAQLPKRFLVGRPLRTGQMGETLLPKKLALPVFCSGPLSSVAYATEEILLALSIGGLAMFHLSWWVGAGVVFLLL